MIQWYEKIFVGAIGALCLSLLKLMNANFYLGVSDRAVAIGAYLTYGAYLILGMAVGFFFCEEAENDHKTRKSAFLMGLLAPSILIAIVSKPVAGSSVETKPPSDIPVLSEIQNFLTSTAYAQLTKQNSNTPEINIQTLPQKEFKSSFGDGVLSALGRQYVPEDYLFIVGKTTDQSVAIKKAAEINSLFYKSKGESELRAHVFKAEANNELYLAVGRPSSSAEVVDIQRAATDTAIKAITGVASEEERATAKILLRGEIVKSNILIAK